MKSSQLFAFTLVCSALGVSGQEVAPTLVPPEMFQVPEGLEVTVWATTPMVYNPVNMDFDQDGRLWISEGAAYRSLAATKPEGDRILILEDKDGDGKAETSKVFWQDPNLTASHGISVLDGKVILVQPPEIFALVDVDGDGRFDPKVDRKEVILSGFNGRQHDHSLHAVTAGPDGKWYINHGNLGAKFTDRSGKTFRIGSAYDHQPYSLEVAPNVELAGQKSDDGRVWVGGFSARMEPDGSKVEIVGHNFRNSYEHIHSSFGELWQSDNDDPPACRVGPVMEYGNAGFASADGKRTWQADQRPGQDTPTAEWRQDDPGVMPAGDIYGGGSPTGVGFYENGALPESWNGTLLAAEAAKNVIFSYQPRPQGAGFKLERKDFMNSNPEGNYSGADFVGGSQNVTHELPTLFRPSDVTVGPDGAIYVADWFDSRVGGHSVVDKGRSGTIYRIAPKGFKSVVPKIDLNSVEGQITALRSPALHVRYSGFVRLKAQGDRVLEPVKALLDDSNPFIAARAIWLLPYLGEAGIQEAWRLLEHSDPNVRLVAFRSLKRAEIRVLEAAQKLVKDLNPALQREVATTVRNFNNQDALPLLIQLAKQYPGNDRSWLEAIGTGAEGREQALWSAIAPSLGDADARRWTPAFVDLAWRLHVPEALQGFVVRALTKEAAEAEQRKMCDAIAFVRDSKAVQALIRIAKEGSAFSREYALWWLLNRHENEWSQFDVLTQLKDAGLYRASDHELVAFEVPVYEAGKSPLYPLEAFSALKGDAKRGAISAQVCLACHKIGNQGIEFGPDLTSFGRAQTREVLIKAIIDPSADISHGYQGHRLNLQDGRNIDGILLSHGSTLTLRSMGGLLQKVPAFKVKKEMRLQRSLMTPAHLLGLDRQQVMDVVEYLRTLEAPQPKK